MKKYQMSKRHQFNHGQVSWSVGGRDGSQTEVKVLDTPDVSDNDNESGSSSATSGDEGSSNTIPNQHQHQVPSEYLHPATYVNVQPKLYKPDEH